ncbi:MAG TPA: hypothetical protein VG055_29190, partial [Planctomycetaceae bacterium]|nr:hypothetical protein [Planctomycetaceae bacterium]
GGGGLGGGGMGGGGMFSIPSEPLRSAGPASSLPAEMPHRARPARAADNSAAWSRSNDRAVAQVDDSSAFTNDAVRASKKKQNDAR